MSIDEKNLNLLALLPCPLKVPIEEEFKNFIKSLKNERNIEFNYLVESHATNQLSFYEKVNNYESIDDIPDIVITPGINSFFHKSFIDKFISKDIFTDVTNYDVNKNFKEGGIQDPDGHYTMFSMNILVMVVDLVQLGDLPMPKKWGDLLNPEYKNRVVIRGDKNFFCETTLLNIYKDYGYDGIKKLGNSVKDGWHPSQMVKMAGSGLKGSPTISVMPYFYARTIRNKDKVSVVWPEDGAIVSPVSMLVKKSCLDKYKEIADFFVGETIGKICAGASFPSINPNVENKIPENAPLKWIGWDYIKSQDIKSTIDNLNKYFFEALRGD
ncbi:ABC transporter substrate-binding protein [Clostridium sp. DJ247]|uniref:ABC transporter substrate-binding protein n=1 Tax=Clostridium sp. DJ247 TaxID=2726188 RepID=UPI001627A1AC|nr:ABC transporter substrate-binding protein [Clostridium sp. DJ247]MBC2582792.1 ABC transporter substrate-binding protein [Clostridium sp. DJ247]